MFLEFSFHPLDGDESSGDSITRKFWNSHVARESTAPSIIVANRRRWTHTTRATFAFFVEARQPPPVSPQPLTVPATLPSPPVISIFAKMYSKSRRAEGLVLQSLRLSTEFNYVELVTKWKNIKYVVCAKISSTFVMTNEYPTDIAFVTQSARLKSMDFRGLHARYEEKLYSFRREISFARVNIMEIMEFWRVLYLDGEKEYL